MTASPTHAPVDLRRVPLADLRTLDFRDSSRDLRADERALWDRLLASWAGLDEAAWHLLGAAPSDAGGPDWSMAEHVGHLADWQELAIEYIATARTTGRWPSDRDFDGGDFDRFNEDRREPWATMAATAIVERLLAARPRLLAGARAFTDEELRGDTPWGWVYMTLHGHYLDHLAILEPWAATLRVRQADGDPFIEDPRAANHADFRAQDEAIAAQFDQLVRTVPLERWESAAITPGWTLRDHVGHLADWAAAGTAAIEVFQRRGHWLADPEEGVDAWNERHVADARAGSPAEALARYDDTRAALLDAVATLSVSDLRSPDGWSWAYDCLQGHTRKHLAMVGWWCATASWPPAP